MFRSLNLAQLAHAFLEAGDHSKALRTAGEALASARERGERGQGTHALRILADITSAAPHATVVGDADALYKEALALGRELSMRPLVAHCHLGLGKLYRRTVGRQEAQEHLATVTTMYREMGMPFYLEQTEPALKEMA